MEAMDREKLREALIELATEMAAGVPLDMPREEAMVLVMEAASRYLHERDGHD